MRKEHHPLHLASILTNGTGALLDLVLPCEQDGKQWRDPNITRFVYEDRPEWWPDIIGFSSEGVEKLTRGALVELHNIVVLVGT